MKLSCPACGFVGDVDAFLAERAEMDAIALALSLPAPLAAPLMQYLRLFRPPKRALTARRVGALLAELVAPIKEARVERHGRAWVVPVVSWQLALDEVLAKRDQGKLSLPLKSHGYLFEVVAGMAASAEAKSEAKSEDRRAGRTPTAAVAAHQPAQLPRAPERDPVAAEAGLKAMKAALRKEAAC